jgi:hypothetical protein
MEVSTMVRTETVEVWVPVFDWALCTHEFGFTVIGQPDKRRASLRRHVETLAKEAAATIVAQLGVQILNVGDCGHVGYDYPTHSENYLAVRVRVQVEIPEDVVACVEPLKRLPKEVLREQIQRLHNVGDKQHARRWDISATLLGDWFADGYCLEWSAIYRQLCVHIRERGRAYVSRNEFLSLTQSNTRTEQTWISFLQRIKASLRR